MSKTSAAILVAMIALFAFVPSVQAQSFTEMAQMRLAMGPGGNRFNRSLPSMPRMYEVGARMAGRPEPSRFDTGYDTPDRGRHQATQDNQNLDIALDFLNLGVSTWNAVETHKAKNEAREAKNEAREANQKLDRIMRRGGNEPRRNDYETYDRRVEHQPEPEPPAPALAPEQIVVSNSTGCRIILYSNQKYFSALEPGEKMVVDTLAGLTASGSFNGKMAYADINPSSDGADITAPKS